MKVQLPDCLMAYEDQGTGLPLLLVHGYPLNRTLWAAQGSGLADIARVIAPDLRGHGESTPTPAPISMESLADDLNQLLDTLQVTQPVILCGLSMGGYVAFEFCRKYPQRLAGLIFAATKAGADTREGKANRDKAATTAQQNGVSAVVESMLPKMFAPRTYEADPRAVAQARTMIASTSLPTVVADLMGMKERPDYTAVLASIDKPTLVLHGAADQLIPAKEAEIIHKGIKGSQLQLLPEAGHLLNMEQPARFNQAVRSFISSIQK